MCGSVNSDLLHPPTHTALESLWHGSASVGDVARSLASILPQLQNSDKKMYELLSLDFLFPSLLSLPFHLRVEQSKPLLLSGDDGSLEEEVEKCEYLPSLKVSLGSLLRDASLQLAASSTAVP